MNNSNDDEKISLELPKFSFAQLMKNRLAKRNGPSSHKELVSTSNCCDSDDESVGCLYMWEDGFSEDSRIDKPFSPTRTAPKTHSSVLIDRER